MDSEYDINKILSEIDEEPDSLDGDKSGDEAAGKDYGDHLPDSGIDNELIDSGLDELSQEKGEKKDPKTKGANDTAGLESETEDLLLREETLTRAESVEEETGETGNRAPSGFSLRGTKSWNTREPYLIPVDEEKLRQEEEFFGKSFYFIREETDENRLQSEIKKAFAGFMRNPSRTVSGDYREHIFKKIIAEIESITTYFRITPGRKDLFIYHLGPLNLYRIVKERFDRIKSFCYRYDSDKGRAVSFSPDEFIKSAVLGWFEENINTRELPFDSIQVFDEFTMLVSKKYMTEKKVFSKKLDKLNYRLGTGKRISGKELIKLKGEEWFGTENITVFKRYLTKTIFH